MTLSLLQPTRTESLSENYDSSRDTRRPIKFDVTIHLSNIRIEFYLFVSHGCMKDKGSTCKFRKALRALPNLHVDLCHSYLHEKQTSRIQSLKQYGFLGYSLGVFFWDSRVDSSDSSSSKTRKILTRVGLGSISIPTLHRAGVHHSEPLVLTAIAAKA